MQGDVARLNAQKIFMAALVDKCLNRVSKFKIPALVGAFIGKVNTDIFQKGRDLPSFLFALFHICSFFRPEKSPFCPNVKNFLCFLLLY